METIVIDGAMMSDRDAAHDYLAQSLSLPDYYGRNLDALYDLLTEHGEPLRLLVRRREALRESLGEYGDALLRTLQEAAESNSALEVAFEEE